jgi:hypothetical protein
MKMADIRKIRVMISSRSLTTVFGDTPLKDVRERLKSFIHSVRWQGISSLPGADSNSTLVGRDQSLFDVWIHEDDVGRAANTTTLEMSLSEINRADIIVVLYTGDAGSANVDDELGICHAELKVALDRRSELVVIVELLQLSASQTTRDVSFRKYVEECAVPRMQANDEAALQIKVTEALQQCVSRLVRRGGSVGARKRDRGQALDWNRLDLTARQKEMCNALINYLPAEIMGGTSESVHRMDLPCGEVVAVRIDAIPDSLSVAAARERVGQPFMQDHLLSRELEHYGVPGVVHVIACHQGITETQAKKMLGTPDAMSVPSDFGVYVADHVQKIQIVFLAQCRDETAVALAVRRFREWLGQTGEEKRLIERAESRGRILKSIAKELTP